MKKPIIDVTDLYHPHQDVGDNFDLVAAYALPEIDLRAVILDCTEPFRHPRCEFGGFVDTAGPRDPGFIPVTQLNYIFNRNVPAAVSPFHPMKSPDDKLLDAPGFQQTGIELILQTLREAREPVSILVFCSCRAVAAAFNREPKLFRDKVERLHLCIGTCSPDIFSVDYGVDYTLNKRIPLIPGTKGYMEWNVELDPHAFVRLLRSELPIALYPDAAEGGGFALDRHNTFYRLPNLEFIRNMHPQLRSYLAYAFNRTCRNDFLCAMDEPPAAEFLNKLGERQHNVWETAVWLGISGRKLVKHANGQYRIVPPTEVRTDDTVLPNEMRPCTIKATDDGRFDFKFTDKPTNFAIYDRVDPQENQIALREALPALYQSFLGA